MLRGRRVVWNEVGPLYRACHRDQVAEAVVPAGVIGGDATAACCRCTGCLTSHNAYDRTRIARAKEQQSSSCAVGLNDVYRQENNSHRRKGKRAASAWQRHLIMSWLAPLIYHLKTETMHALFALHLLQHAITLGGLIASVECIFCVYVVAATRRGCMMNVTVDFELDCDVL